MIKKILIILTFSILTSVNAYSAGSNDGGGEGSNSAPKNKSNYEKAVLHIKAAKKYEKKGKLDKAKKRYVKAQKLLLESNVKKPNKPDTLNYLGFTTRKLGDYENGEKYYLQGLELDPNHIGINEYLGELYVATNRVELAKERLEILKGCNCDEFNDLKEIIAGTKQSKY